MVPCLGARGHILLFGGIFAPDSSSLAQILIGTRVTLYYMDDGTEEGLTICFPEKTDPDQGRVSFLSPIGRQLLMNRRDEPIRLEMPIGPLDVIVRDIRFVDW